MAAKRSAGTSDTNLLLKTLPKAAQAEIRRLGLKGSQIIAFWGGWQAREGAGGMAPAAPPAPAVRPAAPAPGITSLPAVPQSIAAPQAPAQMPLFPPGPLPAEGDIPMGNLAPEVVAGRHLELDADDLGTRPQRPPATPPPDGIRLPEKAQQMVAAYVQANCPEACQPQAWAVAQKFMLQWSRSGKLPSSWRGILKRNLAERQLLNETAGKEPTVAIGAANGAADNGAAEEIEIDGVL